MGEHDRPRRIDPTKPVTGHWPFNGGAAAPFVKTADAVESNDFFAGKIRVYLAQPEARWLLCIEQGENSIEITPSEVPTLLGLINSLKEVPNEV